MNNTEIYDAIIVGAGPGGSTAGILLSKMGYNVLIVDKSKFPREKFCGGGITSRTLEMFPFIRDLMEIEVKSSHYHYKNSHEYIVEEEKPYVYLIRRKIFDNDLLKMAKDNGVEVLEEVKVTDITYDNNCIEIICNNNQKYRGCLVLGCDGVNSKIRQKSGLNKYWRKDKVTYIFSNEIDFNKVDIDNLYGNNRIMHNHICYEGVIGYGWVFPKTTSINIGFGGLLKDKKMVDIKEVYKRYIQYCEKNGLLPKLDEIPKSHAWGLQMGGPMKKCTANRILLIGDSAGFVYPISGEGILYAMWSAKIASELIDRYFKEDLSLDLLYKKYESACWKEFGREQRFIAKYFIIGFKNMGKFFQLAQNDKKLQYLQQNMMKGEESLIKLMLKFGYRIIIGILKGNLWKKSK